MKLISLGCDCSVASWLKDNNYREESYPFDWLVTNMYYLINVFKSDDFKLINIEKLNFVGEKMITNNERSFSSIHDFKDYNDKITYEQFIEYIPKLNEKYKKRFHRLFETIKNETEIIFIRKILIASQTDFLDDIVEKPEYYIQLLNILNLKFGNKFKFILIDTENILQIENINIKIINNFDQLKLIIASSQTASVE